MKGNSMNCFSATLPSTAATSVPPKRSRPFLEPSINPRAGRDQNRGHNDARQHVNSIVVSKINCSKNDGRSVSEIDPKQPISDHPAGPPRQNGDLGVAARKAIVMSRFQTVQSVLHAVEQPQSLQRNM